MHAKATLADRLAGRNPQGALARAKALEAERKFGRALHLYVIAAQAGIAEAERHVGNLYLTGNGTVRNAMEAGRWFLRAAEKGDIEACRQLAGLLIFGLAEDALSNPAAALFTGERATGTDYAAALRWALAGAQAGDLECMVWAGYVYAAGSGELHDEAKAEFWFEKAAAAGAPKGHLGLGVLRLRKANDDASTFAAVAHLREAAAADLPAGHYYMGFVYENAVGVLNDPALAVEHYGHAARAGIRAAQTKYGYALLHGLGIKASPVEGETWLRRAGLKGDADAAAMVASIYATGNGKLPPSFAEAANWFRLAAERGHAASAKALGVLYTTGAGVPRDADEAAKWFAQAVETGDETARVDLASLMLKGKTSALITKPVPVHEWFEQAAQAGDLIGAFNYAVCLAQGFGVEQDEARAAHWFRIAAEGVANAQFWLGRYLAEGTGVARDPQEARVWLQKAAMFNLADACAYLASMWLEGIGGPRDHDQARAWFERAAAQGHVGAMFALGALHGGGHEIAQNRAESLKWYQQGAQKGHAMAALMLGKYYLAGIATQADTERAKYWFGVAAKAGIEEAKLELETMSKGNQVEKIS